MKTIRVEVTVTVDDITNGERFGCIYCPVARALRRAAPHGWRVGGFFAHLCANGVHYCAELPQAVRDFIVRFDGGKDVEPFTFEIKLPVLEEPTNA